MSKRRKTKPQNCRLILWDTEISKRKWIPGAFGIGCGLMELGKVCAWQGPAQKHGGNTVCSVTREYCWQRHKADIRLLVIWRKERVKGLLRIIIRGTFKKCLRYIRCTISVISDDLDLLHSASQFPVSNTTNPLCVLGSFKISYEALFCRKVWYLWNFVLEQLSCMHMRGPPRLNYSELYFLSVIRKLSQSQTFYLKNIPNLLWAQASVIALHIWVTVTYILLYLSCCGKKVH